MAIVMVTYDLRSPGRNYQPVHDYLKRFTYCKGLESFWLLDTTASVKKIRDDLHKIIDTNDVVFVSKITQDWAAYNYGCAKWLNEPARGWNAASMPA